MSEATVLFWFSSWLLRLISRSEFATFELYSCGAVSSFIPSFSLFKLFLTFLDSRSTNCVFYVANLCLIMATDPTTTVPKGSGAGVPDETKPDERQGALSPLSFQAMNSVKLVASPPRERSSMSGRSNGGISTTQPLASERSTPNKPYTGSSLTPITSSPAIRTLSSEFGKPATQFCLAGDASANRDTSPTPWSAAIGKATSGKSGRVIEKLMGENDMLKREVNIANLKAEEGRHATKMTEAKMEQMASDYEARLHDAAINKTLLKRRERQVADLKSQVDGERSKAELAVEREKGWRAAMEKMETETQIAVADATEKAWLFETRYKTLEGHWKDEGAKVDAKIEGHRKDISEILQLRQSQAEDAQKLSQMCEQYKSYIEHLEQQNAQMEEQFRKYRTTQEALLKGIKEKAAQNEMCFDSKLEEAVKAVGELKWALNVHSNVRDAR